MCSSGNATSKVIAGDGELGLSEWSRSQHLSLLQITRMKCPTCSVHAEPQRTQGLAQEKATKCFPCIRRARDQRKVPGCVLRCSTQPEEAVEASRVGHLPRDHMEDTQGLDRPGEGSPPHGPSSRRWQPTFKETMREEEKDRRVSF